MAEPRRQGVRKAGQLTPGRGAGSGLTAADPESLPPAASSVSGDGICHLYGMKPPAPDHRTPSPRNRAILLALLTLVTLSPIQAQQAPKPATGDNPLLKKFDTNGDGVIDEEERRGVRGKMREMQNRPGAMTPSGKTETVGQRLVTEMQYPSSDGRMIPCVLSMPKGEGPFPVLVTIHGGQGNRDLGYIRTMAAPNQLSPTVNAFNEQPWAILAISYRSGNGALFGMEHDDVIAGIRFAKTLPGVDPGRVGVVGGSHGGHLALVAAEKMGRELLCVAVGSPWMTDAVVYMTGDPASPPLSLVPQPARDELVKNGRSLFSGLTRGRGMSEAEAKEFLAKNSIEGQADRIAVPALFITSRGDDQAPHALIEPMIAKMKAAGKDVSTYTAEKSPHGFYWARTVSAARALRGDKSKEEETEEKTARETIIAFFTRHFSGGGKAEGVPRSPSPPSVDVAGTQSTRPRPAPPPPASQPSSETPGTSAAAGQARKGMGGEGRGTGSRGAGISGASFDSLAAGADEIDREQFKSKMGGSSAIAGRADLAERIFDRLDTDGNGRLNRSEFEGLGKLRGQTGNRGGSGAAPAKDGAPAAEKAEPSAPPVPRLEEKAGQKGAPATEPARTAPVRISGGQVVGEQLAEVRVFRGIPYASAPVGDLRWQAPAPPRPWSGVREALDFGKPALQGETFFSREQQSEDCLSLNVWTPAKAGPDAKLPVMVWIHGGAFIQGSGAQPRYDGSALARRGIVVISVNYRLGPLGLFAHPALTAEAGKDAPLGNFCLLDMMAALRWTRENVSAFGGDAGNVTVSGSSAGGTSCLFLMGVPQAQGLFHKAIIHSSGGIRNIQTLEQAEAAGRRLVAHLGLDADAKAADLRRVRGDDIALSTALFRRLDLPVKPIVDGRLVTRVPADTFAQGKQARIPVLMGAANGESGARQLGDDVATGGAFGFQLENATHMARAGQPVYLFQLTYVPPDSRSGRHAAMHGESVAYAFGTIGLSTAKQYGFRNQQVAQRAEQSRRGGGAAGFGGGEDDTRPVEDSPEGRKISEAMLDYWSSFMRTGRPTAPNLPDWPAYSPDAPKAMVFGNTGIGSRGFSTR
jgi:para-nitrobenzyl esterase